MTIYYKQGDVIQAFENNEIDVLAHCCNCFCVMGKGIAKQIKKKYPEAAYADLNTVAGDRDKLGTISFVNITESKAIVNLYGQFTYWNKKDMLYLNKLRDALLECKSKFPTSKIGIPKIGSGLANGDWNEIESMITEVFKNFNPGLFIYTLK